MTTSSPHSLDLIAGHYVLGLLSPSARRRMEAKMLQDSALQDAVHQWERLLNPLAQWLPPVAVPDHVWQNISQRIDGQPSAGAVMTATSPATPNSATPNSTTPTTATPTATAPKPTVSTSAANDSLWKPWAWLSSVVAAGLAAFIVLKPSAPIPVAPAQVQAAVRDLAVLNAGDQAAWIVRQQGDQLILSNLNAASVPTDRDLELWSIQGSNAPRSLGLVRVRQGQAVLPRVAAALISADSTLAISLEPKNGSPTGAPTGEVLYVGKIPQRQA